MKDRSRVILAIVIVVGLVLTGATGQPAQAQAGDLFISEYIEGSGNNKALEIYNTPGATNQAYVPPPEACGDTFTPIYDVQGADAASPWVGMEVAVEGVVVGDFQNNKAPDIQALEAGRRQDVSRIILTASGGPFRTWSRDDLLNVTLEQALAHPNWDMGRKISIDSATMMNKGLEVIEAKWLFDVEPDQIGVVVHPQSIVHSLVEFIDGSVVAQLGIPDMRIPIAYALSYPKRLALGLSRLSLSECGNLSFEKPDYVRFPALQMAFDVLEQGGVKPTILNAANEVAVEHFLSGKIEFLDIADIVASTLAQASDGSELDLQAILAADVQAREIATEIIQSK